MALIISRMIKRTLRPQDYLATEVSKIFGKRPSSFPFISGDTFLSSADVRVYEDTSEKEILSLFSFNSVNVISIELDFIRFSPCFTIFVDWLSELETKPVLIIHNGDLLPDKGKLTSLHDLTEHIFMVNVLEEKSNLSAIPIGLENLHYRNNGRLDDFEVYRNFHSNKQTRHPRIVGAFNRQTNITSRYPLSELLMNSKHGFMGERVSQSVFRSMVSNSMFVASPPGNGMDCHRTWEAIYLGAVPIVEKGKLAPSLIEQLPILEVSDWRTILELSDSALVDLYEQTIKKSSDRAYMPYWINKIRSFTNE